MSSFGYTKLPSEAIWTKNKNPLKSTDLRGFLVRVVGLKPTSLAVPNRAFYQLNYTRKSKNSISEKTEKIISLWSKLWQNQGISSLRLNKKGGKALCCMGFRDLRNTARTSYNNVPKQARYQLRYTRIFVLKHYNTFKAKIKIFLPGEDDQGALQSRWQSYLVALRYCAVKHQYSILLK